MWWLMMWRTVLMLWLPSKWNGQVDGLVYACPDMSQVSIGLKRLLCPCALLSLNVFQQLESENGITCGWIFGIDSLRWKKTTVRLEHLDHKIISLSLNHVLVGEKPSRHPQRRQESSRFCNIHIGVGLRGNYYPNKSPSEFAIKHCRLRKGVKCSCRQLGQMGGGSGGEETDWN